MNAVEADYELMEPAKRKESVVNVKDQVQREEAGQPLQLRKDFRETAFFYPDVMTDKNGEIILKFTMPEALTRWKFMGLAYSKDLKKQPKSKRKS